MREFEERTELRARRKYVQERQKNPFLARDSDSDSDAAKSQEKLQKIKGELERFRDQL